MLLARRRFLSKVALFKATLRDTEAEISEEDADTANRSKKLRPMFNTQLFAMDTECTSKSGSERSSANSSASIRSPQFRLQGPALQAHGLTFETIAPDGTKATLLSDVNCNIEYGKLTAIMGPSGAGKSTLLHVIGGRRKDGSYEGQVTLNGISIEETGVIFGVRYVRQFPIVGHPDQIALASLLNYGHRHGVGGILASGQHADRDALYKRAAGVVHIFKMREFIGRKIGMLSGGQLKLLRVAQVMLLSPRVILLDEPTSGLDALTAEVLIRGLKEAASHLGFCIGVVIHQPAENLFAAFDKIICLRAGEIVFDGPFSEVQEYMQRSVPEIIGRPWSHRTFPDWLLDAAQNFPTMSYVVKMDESNEDFMKSLQKANREHLGMPSRTKFSFRSVLASEVSLYAIHGYNPFEALMVLFGCLSYCLIIFLPLNLNDSWAPNHDVFRVTITGFVVGLQATRVCPSLYVELSLQINDLYDGVIHPMAAYFSMLHFTVVFCTVMGCLNTVFLNIILPIIARIDDPFGTGRVGMTGWNGTELETIGPDVLISALVLNSLLSNVFGLLGLFILCTLGNFRKNLPPSESTTVMFYLTAVLASCSLFGGTVYSEKESDAHMKYFLYASPTYWYIKGSFISWFIGREYKGRSIGTCSTTGEQQLDNPPVCGDRLFENLYGSDTADQSMPLIVLTSICFALAVVSAGSFSYQMKPRHSRKREMKDISASDWSSALDWARHPTHFHPQLHANL